MVSFAFFNEKKIVKKVQTSIFVPIFCFEKKKHESIFYNVFYFNFSVFMSENGMDCVQDHREDIMKCVNSSVPELFNTNAQKYSNIHHLIIFSPQNCRRGEAIRVCVENSLLKCKDPTPSNVVNSLLQSMQKATPCKGSSASYTAAASKASEASLRGHHRSLYKQLLGTNYIVTLLVSFIMIFSAFSS